MKDTEDRLVTTRGGSADMKRGVWMVKVNEVKNTEAGRQTRGRMDFRNPMQLRFPELRMEVSTREQLQPSFYNY